MARNYDAPRKSGLYDPQSDKPYNLSRVRIELFERCQRCFYIDRRLGIDQPPSFPFKLNSAVDNMLKNEFDIYREEGEVPIWLRHNGVEARPARNSKLDDWRNTFKGVRSLHEPTNLEIFGAIDDLWVSDSGEHHVVDYKATARKTPVETLDDINHSDGYKRQLEVYQWLLRRNGLDVSDTAYWVYATGRPDEPTFDARIDFDMRLIPYEGDDSWVEPTLYHIKNTLDSPHLPDENPDCDHCKYARARQNLGEQFGDR